MTIVSPPRSLVVVVVFDGTGLDSFRFDPHEETDPTTYRLNNFFLAADHVADKRFTVVVQGERSSTVDISYRYNQGSPVGLTTLSANRNSDTFIWNTESLPSGVYTLQSKVGLTTFSAPGPVVVEHSEAALDTTAPVLQVDVPVNGHVFAGSLQLSGYALDNRKVAVVEAHLDGALIDSFSPSNFDTRARDAYPTFPSASDSGFNRFVDTSGLASGAHTVTITAYDTAGNTSTHTATVTKAAGANPAGFVVPFTEGAPVTVPDGVNNDGSGGDNPDGAPTKRPRLSVRLNQSTLTFTLSANGACPTLRLLGGISKAALASSPTIIATSSTSKLNGSSAGLYKLKAQRNPPKLFIGGDCGAGSSIVTSSIDPTRIAARRSVKNVSAVLARVLARYRNGR